MDSANLAAMMSASGTVASNGRTQLRHNLRTLRVLAGADFQLKYAGSILGYVWSVSSRLRSSRCSTSIFGRVFRLGEISEYYPLSL